LPPGTVLDADDIYKLNDLGYTFIYVKDSE